MSLPSASSITIALVFLFSCQQAPPAKPLQLPENYVRGQSLYNVNNDSAFYYFNKVVSDTGSNRVISAAYTYLGLIQQNAGDYFGSQESVLLALSLLDEDNEEEQGLASSGYNALGNNSRSLKNYDDAIRYYSLAAKLTPDSSDRLINLNNLAVCYREKKQFDQAYAIYDSILGKSKNNAKEYARILSNWALTKWQINPGYNAAPELLTALEIRRNEADKWGLNASYGHLAEYYENTRPDSALHYARQMYAVARELDSPDDQLFALQKLMAVNPSTAIKQYFDEYQHLNDSLQTARNSAKNQFALIRYETEKHKSRNLALQTENAEKKARIVNQQMILLITVLTAFALLFWYRKKKQQAIREQQLKTSQKVHDVVANGLYRIMTGIEHQPEIDRQSLLDEMETLYEQSRDISYDPISDPLQDFSKEIASLLMSFSTRETGISIVGNTPEIWKGLQEKYRKELKHALQELMVNMKKHSRANNVVVKFELTPKGLNIHYTDDGRGLPAEFRFGNGLNNTENRIRNMGGLFTFNLPCETGLKIQLFIPIT